MKIFHNNGILKGDDSKEKSVECCNNGSSNEVTKTDNNIDYVEKRFDFML